MIDLAAEGWVRVGLVWKPPASLHTIMDEPDPEWAIRPPDEPDPAPTPIPEAELTPEQLAERHRYRGVCRRCGCTVQRRSKVCADCRDVELGVSKLRSLAYLTAEDRLWETLERTLASEPHVPPMGTTCGACGCLLVRADELCPACDLPWAVRAEVAWLNTPTYESTTTETRAA